MGCIVFHTGGPCFPWFRYHRMLRIHWQSELAEYPQFVQSANDSSFITTHTAPVHRSSLITSLNGSVTSLCPPERYPDGRKRRLFLPLAIFDCPRTSYPHYPFYNPILSACSNAIFRTLAGFSPMGIRALHAAGVHCLRISTLPNRETFRLDILQILLVFVLSCDSIL